MIAAVGETVNLHVGVQGADNSLTFQWQWRSNGTTWKNCTSGGYNTDTFSFVMKEIVAGRQYRCCVSDGTTTILSEPAIITLKTSAPVVITDQPSDVSASAGERVTLHVGAEGENLEYQWQWSSNGTTWKNCTSGGYNTDTFSFVMKEIVAGRQYRCSVSDGTTTKVSNAAIISLAASPSILITEQPSDVSASVGDTVTLHVGAEGENLRYQWQWSSNGTTWKNCTSGGYNTDTFRFIMKAIVSGRRYRCVVSDNNGNSETSDTAFITLE